MIEPGKKAPAFSLLGDDGKKHSLKDYSGKWVILYFYPKDMTPGCTTEACDFSTHHGKIRKGNAVVLGISADAQERHVRFKEKYDLPFTLLTDDDHAIHQKYEAYGEKVMYGKKSVGPIRSTFLIDPTGKIAQAWYKVRVNGHVEKVVDELIKNQK